jgi:hypothetical protein
LNQSLLIPDPVALGYWHFITRLGGVQLLLPAAKWWWVFELLSRAI